MSYLENCIGVACDPVQQSNGHMARDDMMTGREHRD